MYELKGYIATVIAMQYNNLYMKMYPTVKPIRVENYLKVLQDLQNQSDGMQYRLQTILEEQPKYNR